MLSPGVLCEMLAWIFRFADKDRVGSFRVDIVHFGSRDSEFGSGNLRGMTMIMVAMPQPTNPAKVLIEIRSSVQLQQGS